MEESTSMLCARVVRGINSTENEVTPLAAISEWFRSSPAASKIQSGPDRCEKKRNVGFAGLVIGTVAENLHHNVGGAKHFGASRGNFAPFDT